MYYVETTQNTNIEGTLNSLCNNDTPTSLLKEPIVRVLVFVRTWPVLLVFILS